jgi:hypothetical protein
MNITVLLGSEFFTIIYLNLRKFRQVISGWAAQFLFGKVDPMSSLS